MPFLPTTFRCVSRGTLHFRGSWPTMRSMSGRRRAVAVSSAEVLARFEGDLEGLLGRLRGGETVKDVAREVELEPAALYGFLLRKCPGEWRVISAAKHLARMEAASEILDGGSIDKSEVAQVANSAKVSSWALERILPALYGAPERVGGAGGVTVQVVVDRGAAVGAPERVAVQVKAPQGGRLLDAEKYGDSIVVHDEEEDDGEREGRGGFERNASESGRGADALGAGDAGRGGTEG